MWVPIVCYDPLVTWNGVVVLVVAPDGGNAADLVARLPEQGCAVVVVRPRGVLLQDGLSVPELARRYLSVGITYMGSCVHDCLRVIDLVESRADCAADVVSVAGLGEGALIAAAAVAIDKRCRALLLAGLMGAQGASSETSQLIGAGGAQGELLSVLSCLVPRPLMVVDRRFSWPDVFETLAGLYRQCERIEAFSWTAKGDISTAEQVGFLQSQEH